MARVMTEEHKAKLAAGRKERKTKAPLTHTVRTRDGKMVRLKITLAPRQKSCSVPSAWGSRVPRSPNAPTLFVRCIHSAR
jgi:hypothetical protein